MQLETHSATTSATAPAASSAEHGRAKQYWAPCADSSVGPPDDGELQSHVLREVVLPSLGPLHTALDVGCGDGRFTRDIADFAEQVLGVDLSPSLIAQARMAHAAAHVHFAVADAEQPLPGADFELVSCMGVLSTLIDDVAFAELARQLADRVRPGGVLITKDTVSLGRSEVHHHADLSVHYRAWPAYRQLLENQGLRLISDIELARWTDTQANVLAVWRRVAPESEVLVAEPELPLVPVQDLGPLAELLAQQTEALLQLAGQVRALSARLDQGEPRAAQAPEPMPLPQLDRLEGTLNLLARSLRGPTLPLRCVFLIHHATAWPALRDIVDAMHEAADFEPILVSLPHRFPLLNRMGGEQEVHDMLCAQGYQPVRVRDAEAAEALSRVKSLAPAVIFRQAPWDNDLPASLSSSNLSFSRLCYVPYGYMTARIERQQFDQDFHRLCWRIFCPDEAHRALFAQHNLLGDVQCRITGYPKFDLLARQRGEAGRWPLAPRQGSFRLIWAPHFSTDGEWLKFGAFDRMAADMLSWVAAGPSLQVVLRPHPAMREQIQHAPAGSPLARFMQAWLSLPNTAFSVEADYAELFAASQALLTDGLSFFSEYQLFDKPLLFWERDDHVGFNDAGARLLDGMYRVHDFSGFTDQLAQLRAGIEHAAVRGARQRIARELRPFPGEAAARIVDQIRRDLGTP